MKEIIKKLTVVWSPNSRVGKTTITNNLALTFAKKEYLTCVIDLNRYIGTAYYLNVNEKTKVRDKNIAKAIVENERDKIRKNFIQSKHNQNLFTLSLTVDNKLEDLYRYTAEQIENIIKVSIQTFDKVIIDLPSDYIEHSLFASLKMNPNQMIVILDNDYITMQKLKLYDDFFTRTKVQIPDSDDILYIYNKVDDIDENLQQQVNNSLELFKINNPYRISYISRIIQCNNNGELIIKTKATSKKEKIMKKVYESINEKIIS